MNRKPTIQQILIIAFAACFPVILVGERQPNVILIMADDLGFEALGSYGGVSYGTPVLDKLAADGVRFSNAHALPLCTPTRVSLMTGKYNWRNWKAFGILDPEARTFGHWMTEAGYRTCISGKWQLQSYNPPEFMPEWRGKGQKPEDSGFEEYFLWHTEHTEDKGDRYPDPRIQTNGSYLTDTEGKYGPDLYVDYINSFMERNKDDPFFVYFPMALTHGPFQPTPDSPEWPKKRHDEDPKYFKDMVEYMDKSVGRILEKLSELELENDTILIFYSDNGSPPQASSRLKDGRIIPGGKGLTNYRGTRVPLIVSWPKAANGRVVDDLIDCNDILPTIFDACRVPLPKDEIFDGQSFFSQIRGIPSNHRDWLFFHHDPLPGARKKKFTLQRWAIDKRWKLSEQTGNLYDLSVDPEETSPIDPNTTDIHAIVARGKLQAVIDNMGLEYQPWTK